MKGGPDHVKEIIDSMGSGFCELYVLGIGVGHEGGARKSRWGRGGGGDRADLSQFSWSYVEGAVGYEVVVFEGEEGLSYEEKSSLSEALIEKVIPSPGLTWAPEGGGCLKSGKGYVWYVRAVDARGTGVWSEGARFRVDEKAMVEALREPVQEVVREYFSSEQVVKEKLVGLEGKIREEVKRELEGGSFIGTSSTPKVLGVEGPNNTLYGTGAGAVPPTGVGNSFFGVNAGNKTTTGNNNTFLGYHAGLSNTTGYDNTFLGLIAGVSNTTGNFNTFLGPAAGVSNTTGNYNTFLGRSAGYSNTTGAGNVFLGYTAGYSETGSNKLYIDNSNTPTPLIYGEFDNGLVKIHGTLQVASAVSPSDERLKRDIRPLDRSLEKLTRLQGVQYSWRTEEYAGWGLKEGIQVGLIAQEVEKLIPEVVHTASDGYKAIDYQKLVPVLIEALKEQGQKYEATLQAQQAEINELKALMTSLHKR